MSAKITGTVPVLDQIFIPFNPSSLCLLGAKFILIWDIAFRNKRKQQITERYAKGKPVILEGKKKVKLSPPSSCSHHKSHKSHQDKTRRSHSSKDLFVLAICDSALELIMTGFITTIF